MKFHTKIITSLYLSRLFITQRDYLVFLNKGDIMKNAGGNVGKVTAGNCAGI